MKEIKLTQGKFALIDDEDFEKVNQLKWHTRKVTNTYYAQCGGGNNKIKTIHMHRYILGISDQNIKVDHKDRNGLNNQRDNLRIATHNQNRLNCPSRNNSVSKYKGVSWCLYTKKWRVRVMKDGKSFALGYFNNEADAALAYNKKAIELHGEFAFINIIS